MDGSKIWESLMKCHFGFSNTSPFCLERELSWNPYLKDLLNSESGRIRGIYGVLDLLGNMCGDGVTVSGRSYRAMKILT